MAKITIKKRDRHITWSVSLPMSLASQLDAKATELDVSRSQITKTALRFFLEQAEQTEHTDFSE